MTPLLDDKLRDAGVVPLIQADDASTAVAIAEALAVAGMPLLEVVMRTDASLASLEEICKRFPDLIVGAGTVLSGAQAERCIDAGARFVVSPGLDESVVETTLRLGLPVLPGIMTPTELQRALNLGLETVKFFPAATAGGTAAIAGLAAVFRRMRFVPTGGISAENLSDYLAIDAVIACGGSWMTPKAAVASGDFDRITRLASDALAVAARTKGSRA